MGLDQRVSFLKKHSLYLLSHCNMLRVHTVRLHHKMEQSFYKSTGFGKVRGIVRHLFFRLNLKSYFTPARRVYLSMALLRVLMGAFFIYDGYIKLNDPNFAVRLPSMLEGWAANNPIFFYQDILNLLVIPNGWFFAQVVTYLELIIGVGYVLGAFMPAVVLLQVFLNLNFLMAAQHTHPSELIVNLAFLVIALVLLSSNAGIHYGLDQWLPDLHWGKAKKKKRKVTKVKDKAKANSSKSKVKSKAKSKKKKKAFEPMPFYQGEEEETHDFDDEELNDSEFPEFEDHEFEEGDDEIDLADFADFKRQNKPGKRKRSVF